MIYEEAYEEFCKETRHRPDPAHFDEAMSSERSVNALINAFETYYNYEEPLDYLRCRGGILWAAALGRKAAS